VPPTPIPYRDADAPDEPLPQAPTPIPGSPELAAAAAGAACAADGIAAAAGAVNEDEDTRLPPRRVLEALHLQHLGRDVSRAKLTKPRLAALLPASVLAAAVAAMRATPRSKSTARRLHAAAAAAAGGGAAAARPQGAGAAPAAPAWKGKKGGAAAAKAAKKAAKAAAKAAKAAPAAAAKAAKAAAKADAKAAKLAAAAAAKAEAAAARAAAKADAAATDELLENHNAAAAARLAEAAPLREARLAQHLPVLRPFIPADVAARLEAAAAAAPAAAEAAPTAASKRRGGAAARAAAASAASASAPSAATRAPGVPRQLLATLRPHQRDGFRWLVDGYAHGLHPILGDDMGLGKTLQAISLLAHATFTARRGPHLVVVPLSVLPSWQAELARWCPSLRVVRAHACGDGCEKARLGAALADVASYDVALTTYDALRTEGPLGGALRSRVAWEVLVLDEGHKAKSETGALARALRSVRRACTLLLSGTLLQNNMHELWALLSLSYDDVFTDAAPFDAAFRLDGAAAGADEGALRAAHALLRALCLRREKDAVERSLPPKTETRVLCPLAAPQTALYRAALRRAVAADADADTSGGAGAPNVRAMKSLCMELRLICCHPHLVEQRRRSDDDDDADDDAEDVTDEEEDMDVDGTGAADADGDAAAAMAAADAADAAAAADGGAARESEDELAAFVAASGKMAVLDRLLTRLHAGGHRVVIFSQFVRVLDLLARLLTGRGHGYARLDGGVCRARRAVDVMRFNRPGSTVFAFLASTKAGGLGLNLQSADTCILFDSDWNPQADAQAMARVHRIGQTKPVHVYRLVTEHSVEERILARAEKKLYLDAIVARGAGAGGAGCSEDAEAAADDGADGARASDVRFGADAVFRSEAGAAPSEEELDALCDRTPGGEARRAALDALRCGRAGGDATAGSVAAALSAPPPPLAALGRERHPQQAAALPVLRGAACDHEPLLLAQVPLQEEAARRGHVTMLQQTKRHVQKTLFQSCTSTAHLHLACLAAIHCAVADQLHCGARACARILLQLQARPPRAIVSPQSRR
jgi:SWI/SNF-related matrix-associated actin-dependent regulator of chromatin subfamily A member 5